jgi:DNA integrity scanning protein DisA with diadenylate cyclase activity
MQLSLFLILPYNNRQTFLSPLSSLPNHDKEKIYSNQGLQTSSKGKLISVLTYLAGPAFISLLTAAKSLNFGQLSNTFKDFSEVFYLEFLVVFRRKGLQAIYSIITSIISIFSSL